MSRCFPYPPPGYEARERPDLELLLREREKAKERKQRKKEKRERKQKKKEKHEHYGKLEEKKHSIENKGKYKQSKADQTRSDDKKRKLKEVEQVAKSNITEEHGQPASTEDFCGSSDSTLTSGKRRKHDLCAESGHNHGNGVQIGSPLLNCKDLEPPNKGEDSDRAEKPAKVPRTSYKYNALESSILEMDAWHRSLLDNWKPPELQIENPDFDYEDWLFEAKQKCKQGVENYLLGNNLICGSSCYLFAAKVALPYTVLY